MALVGFPDLSSLRSQVQDSVLNEKISYYHWRCICDDFMCGNSDLSYDDLVTHMINDSDLSTQLFIKLLDYLATFGGNYNG